jgi:hypothetical protein
LKNDIEHARQVVAELESKLVAVTDRATALATERRRVAYDVGIGDAKSKTKLEKLTNESSIAAVDVENCHAALEEGRHRLASAEHIADQARRKTDAERLHGQVNELADRVAARGPALAAALATFCDEYGGLECDLAALRQLGVEITPARSVGLAFEAVVSHTLRGIGLRVGNLVAPGRRHDPASMTTGYASRAREWADAILAGEKAEAA